MPRDAKLFDRFDGSPARALKNMTGNIPPSWIARAKRARKSREGDVVRAMKKVQRLRRTRPKALATIRAAEAELRALLKDWELSYRKETFYHGLRVLLELRREGKSNR